jgi:hypothetical protein
MTKSANKDKEAEAFEEVAALWKELMPILLSKRTTWIGIISGGACR